MSTFEDYAALARHLAAQRRAGEQGAAAESARRRDLHAAVDYLDRRLTAQGQRLDQLGHMIGCPPPLPGQPPPGTAPVGPAPDAPTSGGPFAPAPTSGGPFAPAPTSGGPVSPASTSAGPSVVGVPPAGPSHGLPRPGTGSTGGAAAAPGRPGVGAYPQGSPGETALAVPGGVPAPRAGELDPSAELESARRWADEADRLGQQVELTAQRPALLPGWSPVARALAVYLACAGVGVLLMLVMVLASGVGALGLGTLYTWMCAGLPAVSLIAGWLVLGRWGTPAVVAGTPPRYPLLGILVCFLAVPLAYCGYLLMFRALR
ncbi:hypothetical protein KBX06_07810 [Micromonospora sp. C31]|uniref:hypothetical protein n=1 Tax=Micromonospora sp. C31 TaxID=2824876 RepID=UPI001B3586B0|nr:hypothetical protein [Micromonospora sp. C31]MBQ1073066.1 hypothetical protein [Micromonospora sp. C31]